MRRTRVLREGTPTVDGRLIRPAAVKWEGDRIPVRERVDGAVVGQLVGLRREREGWITGVLEGMTLVKGYGLGAALRVAEDGVTERDERYRVVVKDATLIGAHIVSEQPWPGMGAR